MEQPTLHCGRIKRSCGEQGSYRVSLTWAVISAMLEPSPASSAQLTASSVRSKLDLERIIRSLRTSGVCRPIVSINLRRPFYSFTEFDYKVINAPFDDQNRGWFLGSCCREQCFLHFHTLLKICMHIALLKTNLNVLKAML